MALGERTVKCSLCVLLILSLFNLSVKGDNPYVQIAGWRSENGAGVAYTELGQVILYAQEDIILRLFGKDFTDDTSVSFTPMNASKGVDCTDMRKSAVYNLDTTGLDSDSALLPINLHAPSEGDVYYYFCVRSKNNKGGSDRANRSKPHIDDGSSDVEKDTFWVHQGSDYWMRFVSEMRPEKKTILPMWLQILFIVVLLCCSGTFSGLNLGLMSLDKTELQIVINCGSETEKAHAKKIAPLRERGNYLLCTILLGNVLVNNTLAILMDDLTGSGSIAIIAATAGIVVFGEIIPQAVCSRYGLAIGARTIWFTRFFMVVTAPVSWPISKVLDCILGAEAGTVYNRYRLRELIKVTQQATDIVDDEINIIAGALELSRKQSKDIMTKIEDVYMIEYNSILDFETITEIMKTGFTRIPVYEGSHRNVVNILNIKDLAFVDPDDRTPLKTVCKFYNHPVNFVFEDTKLDKLLEEFKTGRSHMSFVRRVNNSGPGDPFYETLGVVTLEDVIEEILQTEIVDETDTITDNIRKAPRMTQMKDFSVFSQPHDQRQPNRISPQLILACFQYLSTSVPSFKPELISETVLQRLLKQNVVVNFKMNNANSTDCFIYTRGKHCDYFVIILEGRVEVDIGKEHMVFEGGPFLYFGMQALSDATVTSHLTAVNGIKEKDSKGMSNNLTKQTSISSINSASDSIYSRQPHYSPDFSVKALTDLQYLKIRRPHYIAARRATMMERAPLTPDGGIEDAFNKEWQRATSIDPDKVTTPPELDESADSNDPADLVGTAGSLAQIYVDLGDTSEVKTADGDVPPRTRADTADSVDADAGTPLMSDKSPPEKSE